MPNTNTRWDWQIDNRTSFWGQNISEIWAYRNLLTGLIRRYFLLNYQQTILGPLWLLFQPVMTLITYVLVFNKLVGITTGTLPPVVFYASGIVLWNFFSDSFTGTSSTFKDNAQLFNKVYFPRIIMPLSVVSTHFLRFLLQLLMFMSIILYYALLSDFQLNITPWILAMPLAVMLIGALGLGLGMIFSVITAKYRDLSNLVALGIRLLMFVTPVIYPMVAIPEKLRWIVLANPLTPLFEFFRFSLLGEGYFTLLHLIYSIVVTGLILLGAVTMFNKQGDRLIDVV